MSMGAFQDPGKSLENPDFQRRTQGREIIRIRVLSGLPLPGPRKGEVMEYTVEESTGVRSWSTQREYGSEVMEYAQLRRVGQ